MKNIIRYMCAACAAALILAGGCSRENAPSSRRTLGVGLDAAKIMLQDAQTVWNEGDEVSVFYKGSSANDRWTFLGSDGDASGTISSSEVYDIVLDGTTYAVWPYAAGNTLSGKVLGAAIPSQQILTDGSYGAAVLVAASDTDNLTFRYASSVLCLTLKNNSAAPRTVTSLTLSSTGGEAVAGNIGVDMENPAAPAVEVVSEASSSVTLSDGSITIPSGESADFYFALAPGTLAQGYTIEVNFSGGFDALTVRNTTSTVLSAGSISRLTGSFAAAEQYIDFCFDPEYWGGVTADTWFTGSRLYSNYPLNYTLEFCGITEGTNAEYSHFKMLKYKSSYALRFNENRPVASWVRIPWSKQDRAIIGIKMHTHNFEDESNVAVDFAVYSRIDNTATGAVLEDDLLASGSIKGDGILYFDAPRCGEIYLYTDKNNAQITSLTLIHTEIQ